MISRRGFFSRLLGAAGAVAVAPFLPKQAYSAEKHIKALEECAIGARAAVDKATGIAIRFIQQYDIKADRHPTRLDCLVYDSVRDGDMVDGVTYTTVNRPVILRGRNWYEDDAFREGAIIRIREPRLFIASGDKS